MSITLDDLKAMDLDVFKAVPPRKDFNFNDFRLPDGSPMVGGGTLLVPPAHAMQSIWNSAQRVFSYRFDEAMRDSFVNARAMRRDGFLWGLLWERLLPTVNRAWRIEVDDDRDSKQMWVRDNMTKIIEATPQFSMLKWSLLQGTWFGRSAVQGFYQRDPDCNNFWVYGKNKRCKDQTWTPVHGDSIQYTFDGIPAILMDSMTTSWYADHGAKWGGEWKFDFEKDKGEHGQTWGDGDLRYTDRGGCALVLQREYWRERFMVHQFVRDPADFFEGQLAGSVQGLGLRGMVYWLYVLRTDALTWMITYMQAVGQMDLLVFNYPAGDAAAKQNAEYNANKVIGKAAIVCPRNPQGNWEAVEQVQMNSAGLKALQELMRDFFDRHIERLFVGQSMSSGADKGTGLGGTGRADFARACVPVEGSEILTRDGFRSPKEVQIGEDVLAYDTETDSCKWTPLLKKSFYEDAEIIKLSNSLGFQAFCTPDHSWAVKDKEGRHLLRKANEMESGDFVMVSAKTEGSRKNNRGFHTCFGNSSDWILRSSSGTFALEDAGRTDVWCPTTKYGTWVMRQNGRVMITGNTKDEILVYDSNRLDEVITGDLLAPLKKYNFPWAKFPVRFKSILPDTDREEKINAVKVMISLGVPVKVDDVRQAGDVSRPEEGDEVIVSLTPGGPPILTKMGPEGPELPQIPGQPPSVMPPDGLPGQGAIPPGSPISQPQMMPPGIPQQFPPMQSPFGFPPPQQQALFPQPAGVPGPMPAHAIPPGGGISPPFGMSHFSSGKQPGVPPINGPVLGPQRPPYPYSGMGYPGGNNTMIPSFGGSDFHKPRKGDVIGFIRYERPLLYGTQDEEAFHAHLDAHPDDHTARMILADHLDEMGDPRGPGYRALGMLGRQPKHVPENTNRPFDRPEHYEWGWLTDPTFHSERNKYPSAVTREWNDAIGEHPDNMRIWGPTGTPTFASRRTAEDAAAHAFSQLPPERQHELLNPPEQQNMQRYERRHAPTPMTYRDKPYRKGQFIPGSVMFQHSPPRKPGFTGYPKPANYDELTGTQSPQPQQDPNSVHLPIDWTSHDTAASSMAEALAHHIQDPAHAQDVAGRAFDMVRSLPPAVMDRLGQGKVSHIVSHASPEHVGTHWTKATNTPAKNEFGLPAGFHDPDAGHIHVESSGEDPVGVLAHELAHAFDWSSPPGQRGYHQASATDDWKKAWRREIAGGDFLNQEAADHPAEGMAEFFRLIHATPNGKQIAQQQFPQAHRVFANWGIA